MLYDNQTGRLVLTNMGNFVEACLDPARYKAVSFNPAAKQIEWRAICDVIKHPRRTEIYKIKTQNSYELKITSCHSVYVWENGRAEFKEGKNIKAGDILIFPARLPRGEQDIRLDLKAVLLKNTQRKDIFVRLETKYLESVPAEARVDLGVRQWGRLQNARQSLGISRYKMAQLTGVYKTVVQQWESKIDNVMPQYGQITQYLQAIGEGLPDEGCAVYLPINRWQGQGI
ncbi:MAG: hypothetical protein Q8N85_02630, partial [Candidatus Omnitrophota bacterium]|nr:hypothetical protein [Candidatus Omnitrophota bacterium]